mmetsp:Transcript_91860/g.256590  ORF Transcript_91860/g.256590 Transcript_91860/m.256590 type:complete len:240 (+) Transcript_91860:124-843(+)
MTPGLSSATVHKMDQSVFGSPGHSEGCAMKNTGTSRNANEGSDMYSVVSMGFIFRLVPRTPASAMFRDAENSEAMHTSRPRSRLAVSGLSSGPLAADFANTAMAAQPTPTTMHTTSSRFESLTGSLNRRAMICCAANVVSGAHERMMRLTEMGSSMRLKLFSAMFTVNAKEKQITVATSKRLLRTFGMYRHGVNHRQPNKSRSRAKLAICCSAVTAKAAGKPFRLSSRDTMLLESTTFM